MNSIKVKIQELLSSVEAVVDNLNYLNDQLESQGLPNYNFWQDVVEYLEESKILINNLLEISTSPNLEQITSLHYIAGLCKLNYIVQNEQGEWFANSESEIKKELDILKNLNDIIYDNGYRLLQSKVENCEVEIYEGLRECCA
jgi:phosphosulfolactate synthase (CoM biosynthesis protein A)